MHLPRIFQKSNSSKAVIASDNSDDAPVNDDTDHNQRIAIGWKAAKLQQRTFNLAQPKYTTKQKFDIKGAALGVNKKQANAEMDDISKKIDDGWKRSIKIDYVREKVRIVKKDNIRLAAVGFGTLKTDNDTFVEAEEINDRIQDGLKRAAKMRGVAPESEKKTQRRNRPGIRGAAIGLTNIETSPLGSSSSLNETEEVYDRLEDGLKRAEKMRGVAPESEKKTQRRNRPGIRGAAIGLTNIETSPLGSSSSLYETEEVYDRLEDGLKRAEKMRDVVPQTEAKHHRRTRPDILNASMGIKAIDISDGEETQKQEMDGALHRAEKAGGSSHTRSRGKIASAINHNNVSTSQDEETSFFRTAAETKEANGLTNGVSVNKNQQVTRRISLSSEAKSNTNAVKPAAGPVRPQRRGSVFMGAVAGKPF